MPYSPYGAGLDMPLRGLRPQPGQGGGMPSMPPRPGIFGGTPLRPKPAPLETPGLQPMLQGDVLTPEAYTGEPMLGTAAYGGQRLNTEGALAGLQQASQAQPWLQRSRAIEAIGSTGRPQDLQLAQALGEDYRKDSMHPGIEETEAAIQSFNPAMQAREEASAIRGSYPAEAQARGQVASADRAAAAREFAAAYGLDEADVEAAGGLAEAAMKGLIDVETLEDPREDLADRQRAILQMFLQRLGYGGLSQPQGR